jgi:alkanesulfonate monooxygenase SsuD/methylene tetrahydromethanopterin reductase-like flavin-dependent oxidoreductase (luciferase family)
LSKIQFGVVVPQGWSYDFSLSDKDRRERDEFIAIKQYEYSKDIAEAIDKYTSIDSIYTYDHFLPYYAPKNETNFFDCFILLSAIAAITDRVKIGQVVTCSSYRNPALLAKMLSTLDIISEGRIELGIGAGWHKEEYRQYGYDFPPAPIRIEQLDEAITIVKSMWTEGRATFRGNTIPLMVQSVIPNPFKNLILL